MQITLRLQLNSSICAPNTRIVETPPRRCLCIQRRRLLPLFLCEQEFQFYPRFVTGSNKQSESSKHKNTDRVPYKYYPLPVSLLLFLTALASLSLSRLRSILPKKKNLNGVGSRGSVFVCRSVSSIIFFFEFRVFL